MKDGPKHAFSPVDDELIEILDENGRSFMLMPRKQAMQQQLPYRVALVVLRNRENKVYIHKRAAHTKSYSGLWSVSASGAAKAGEAMEDAALRELREELGVNGIQLYQMAEIAASAQTDWSRVFLFLSQPANVIVNPAPEEISEGMFVDPDELSAMIRQMPELLTPALKWAYSVCDLFA